MNDVTILIVEDDLIAGEYLESICTKHDLNVCASVDNAKDALAICKKQKPTVILMDIMIKGPISGCELAMQIRAFNKDVIIIFITAYTSEEMIEYALDANAYSYLLKPYRDIEIISTIKMSLRDYKKPKETQEESNIVCKNGFKYDTKKNKLYQYNHELILSHKLLLLVQLLAKYRGSSVSYEQISHAIWGEPKNINTLRAIIHRLKTQLPELELHIVPKSGYVLY